MANEIYGRYWRLSLGAEGELIELGSQDGDHAAKIRFGTSLHADSMLQVAEITLFGLSADTRQKIYDRYTKVRLVAGYVGRFGPVFDGTIYNVAVGRDGPDTSITMYCRSGGEAWERSFFNKTFGPGTPVTEILRDVASSFKEPVLFVGDWSDIPNTLGSLTLCGTAKNIMQKLRRNWAFNWNLSGGQVVIGRLGATLDQGEYIPVIAGDSGMVGSPVVREYGVDVTVKMRSDIAVHNTVRVENVTAEVGFASPGSAAYQGTIGTGDYTVRLIAHTGDSESDTWETHLGCWNPRVAQLSRVEQL
ncbi:baseplate hub protein [Cobetia crustatorum]|uniref:Uncharacterized protein n=1 Tax=Cobetia crustatorum TaxID=553385 RepID=A0A558HXH1_9GAMM|nr:hypothetical protein [Cobetia crustatorum]TVU73843.1 hypothetical protein FQP86_01895 [Cobetia crustatorum]